MLNDRPGLRQAPSRWRRVVENGTPPGRRCARLADVLPTKMPTCRAPVFTNACSAGVRRCGRADSTLPETRSLVAPLQRDAFLQPVWPHWLHRLGFAARRIDLDVGQLAGRGVSPRSPCALCWSCWLRCVLGASTVKRNRGVWSAGRADFWLGYAWRRGCSSSAHGARGEAPPLRSIEPEAYSDQPAGIRYGSLIYHASLSERDGLGFQHLRQQGECGRRPHPVILRPGLTVSTLDPNYKFTLRTNIDHLEYDVSPSENRTDA